MTFNVWVTSNVTSFESYYVTDSLESYNNTIVRSSIYLWTDSNLNYLSVGGSMSTSTANSQDYFVGII